MSRVLIAGCGDLGGRLGLRLVAAGHRVWGMRRQVGLLPPGLLPLAADLTRADSVTTHLPRELDFVVWCAAAPSFDDDAYRRTYVDGLGHLMAALERAAQPPERVLVVSSTSVYGQTGGEWVDEESATHPAGFPGQRLLESEAHAHATPWPSVVLRLGGIYGPGRPRRVAAIRAGTRTLPRSPTAIRWVNLIHIDDAAAILVHLLSVDDPAPVYVGVDEEPVDTVALDRWLAERLGASLATDDRERPPPARAGNKRCSNRRLLESGFFFTYPTYREGYGELLDAGM